MEIKGVGSIVVIGLEDQVGRHEKDKSDKANQHKIIWEKNVSGETLIDTHDLGED